MEFYSKTDIGKKRYSNQDAVTGKIISNDLAFTAVCDGMGGANGGDIASKMAVDKINEVMNKLSESMSEEEILQLMNDSVQEANTMIFEKSANDEILRGMGTTVVLAVIKDNVLYVMHAGDSRAYIISDCDIVQISVDHSLVQQMLDSGKITEKEAKNQLTFYTDTSNSYLAQYAELDESGTPKMNESGNGVFLKPETLSEALQKFKELDEFDFSLTDFSIPLSSFENLTLSPSTLTGLLPFLNVDE